MAATSMRKYYVLGDFPAVVLLDPGRNLNVSQAVALCDVKRAVAKKQSWPVHFRRSLPTPTALAVVLVCPRRQYAVASSNNTRTINALEDCVLLRTYYMAGVQVVRRDYQRSVRTWWLAIGKVGFGWLVGWLVCRGQPVDPSASVGGLWQ